MNINNKKSTRYCLMGLIASFLFFTPGCARYAPLAVAVSETKVLKITLDTVQPIANDIYYYIAIDVSGDPQSEGPLPYLAGEQIAENWSYYIRYFNGQFTEKMIFSPDNLYEEPDIFNSISTRYYDTSISSNSLEIRLKLDILKAGTYNMILNFITSREPLQDTTNAIQVIDYLPSPRLVITNEIGVLAYEDIYTRLRHSVGTEEDKPGDIVNWHVEILNL